MTKFLGLVPDIVWAIAVAALVALGITQSMRLSSARVEYSTAQITIAKQNTAAAKSAERVATLTREASEANRKIEALLASKAKEIADVYVQEKARTEAAVAVARADVRGLRQQLADYAAGTSGTGGSAANAKAGLSAGQRAVALGRVLGTCADTSLSDAGELEDLAGQVRGLQNYWGLTGDHR